MRLSVQLYTLRQPLSGDPVGTLRALKDMGLEYVELAGYCGMSAADFKKTLDDIGLKVSAGHWGLDALEDVAQVSADANLFGCKHVVLPWISEDKYKGGWVEFGKELEPLARAYDDKGFTFGYHNHAFEFVNNGASTFNQMWDQTEDILKAKLDLGWISVAGEDPAAWVDKLGSRAPLVHLKEFSGNKDSHDAEAGKGVIDWDSVLAACERNGVEFGAIEMDNTPDEPLVSVRRSLEFFQSKGLS
jgi:sugar phosphate isomerase/epimerase